MDKIKVAPRIGRQVEHFEMVDLKSISAVFSPCRTYRYLLSFNFKTSAEDLFSQRGTRDKTLTIILKNPSSANELKADKTIRNVETYVYKNFDQVGTVNILNLFAIRATDAPDVNVLYKEHGRSFVIGDENDRYIKKALDEADVAIVAWGGNSKINLKLYNARINEVRELLSDYEDKDIYRVNPGRGSEQYPFHACYWGYNHPKEKVNFVLP